MVCVSQVLTQHPKCVVFKLDLWREGYIFFFFSFSTFLSCNFLGCFYLFIFLPFFSYYALFFVFDQTAIALYINMLRNLNQSENSFFFFLAILESYFYFTFVPTLIPFLNFCVEEMQM